MAAETELASGSLERLVAILDAFAAIRPHGMQGGSPAPIGVSELSRDLGLSKGTVSRYLRRLEEAGVLQRLPDRRYVLGSRVYAWGQAAAPGSDVKRWAHPIMEELAAAFGETVSLFALGDGEAICIDQVDGLHPIRLSAAVGRHLPLHIGASPRLLLAFAPEATREAFFAQGTYPAFGPDTITDAARLRSAVEETRRVGYVVSEGEVDEGAYGVAAPIRDAAGTVRAVVSVAGPANRFVEDRRDAIIAAVRDAAAAVSEALGYRAASAEAAGNRMRATVG